MRKFLAVFTAAVMLLSTTGCQQDAAVSANTSSGTTVSDMQTATVSDEDAVISQPSESEPSTQSTTASSATATSGSEPAVTAQSTTSSAATASSAAASSKTTADTVIEIPQETGLSVSYTIPNTWQEDGMCCTQIEFVIANDSDKPLNSWNVEADVGQNVEVMQNWNSAIQTAGNKLTASNAEYNGEVAAGAQTSFGCIIKTPSELTKVKSVSINGEAAKVTSGSASGGNSAATAATTGAVSNPPAPSEIEATGKFGLVSDIGQLSVKGADLVGADGTPVQLRGVSTHGIQWFPKFANKEVFRYLRDEWNINTIRLAMYTGESEGYTNSAKAGIEQTVQNAVDYCIELDMYVIIDWHVLADQSPQVRKTDALRFFEYMSEKYADYPNVIYEICNEPNGYASWQGDVKPYAEEVIPVIRRNDPDSVIIVGTPTWSQDIDKALADPLKYDNVMYALHYYATTHTDWLRNRVRDCYNKGLPIFVSEFGNCAADGNGSNNLNEATKWLELLDSLNISYMNWSLCDESEAASLLAPGASATGGWTDNNLTENGRFMRDWFKNHD